MPALAIWSWPLGLRLTAAGWMAAAASRHLGDRPTKGVRYAAMPGTIGPGIALSHWRGFLSATRMAIVSPMSYTPSSSITLGE